MAKYGIGTINRAKSTNIEDRRKTDNRITRGSKEDAFLVSSTYNKTKSASKAGNPGKDSRQIRLKEDRKQSYAGNDGIARKQPSKSKNNLTPDRESFLTFKGKGLKSKDNG